MELYRQNGIFNLPNGVIAPAAVHQIRLAGGRHGRNVALQVRDPKHHIAGIELELYDPADKNDESTETITVLNKAATCPPACVIQPGDTIR